VLFLGLLLPAMSLPLLVGAFSIHESGAASGAPRCAIDRSQRCRIRGRLSLVLAPEMRRLNGGTPACSAEATVASAQAVVVSKTRLTHCGVSQPRELCDRLWTGTKHGRRSSHELSFVEQCMGHANDAASG
jgi:hypothetical protein